MANLLGLPGAPAAPIAGQGRRAAAGLAGSLHATAGDPRRDQRRCRPGRAGSTSRSREWKRRGTGSTAIRLGAADGRGWGNRGVGGRVFRSDRAERSRDVNGSRWPADPWSFFPDPKRIDGKVALTMGPASVWQPLLPTSAMTPRPPTSRFPASFQCPTSSSTRSQRIDERVRACGLSPCGPTSRLVRPPAATCLRSRLKPSS